MKTMKKILCSLLVVVMCLTAAPLQGFVDFDWDWFDFSVKASSLAETGQYGDNVFWTFDRNTGTLTFSGYGRMQHQNISSNSPFNGNSEIKKIIVGNGIINVGQFAFGWCKNLESVVLSDTVSFIGTSAFDHCSKLSNVIFSNDLEEIGFYVFEDCEKLENIDLPDNVKRIGGNAFKNTGYYNNEKNWHNKVLYLGNHLINAKCDMIEYYSVMNGTKSISSGAFNDCEMLLKIYIPNSVVYIGGGALNKISGEMLTDVYYGGTTAQWKDITIIDNKDWTKTATIHYNSKPKDNNVYKVGDIIQFGSYPQSEVKDTAVITKLNSLAPAWDNWTSYGYYSGDGNYGSMVQGDWMRYVDIELDINNDGDKEKYRGVKFTQYRPYATYKISATSDSKQNLNGYYINTVYWFKHESIDWRVIDPNTGLVMCETIIDSQPYSDTIYYNSSLSSRYAYFNNSLYKNYASDYETSSIRKWLNNYFYYTAFTDSEKKEINNTTLNNDGHYTSIGTTGYECLDSNSTNDKIFLLSHNEVRNRNFGFDSDQYEYDKARQAQGSDYAKIQGLSVFKSDTYNNNASWILRSPGDGSDRCCDVSGYGAYDDSSIVYDSTHGIRPALRFKDIATATQKMSSYFVVSSDTYSVDSINGKENATYKVHLLDQNSSFLPIDNVTVQNNTEYIVDVSTKKISDTELELTVKPLSNGDASISLFNGDNSNPQYFNFTVYSNTTTYRADQVPVTNEKLKTNFSRGDMTVDNFEYIFDENKGKYIATMDVYNRSGAIGVVAAYTQDGLISDIEQVDPYVPLPGDFGEFLVYLGTGAVSILKGENWNYRYSGYCQKTPIEIEVPEDGYLTVSCDISADEAVLIYNTVSLGVKTAFKTAEIIDYLGTDTDELAKEASKTIVRKTSEYFKSKKGKDWVGKALSKISKKMSKQFSVAYLEEMSMLSFDMLEEICQNVGTDFSTLFFEVIDELIQEEIKSFGVMSVSKKLIKEKVIGVAERNLMKVASAIFEGGEYINFANELLGTYLYNTDTGKTMIVFKPKGEDGFICKDTIKVTSDIITDEVLLHTYVIKDTQKADAFIRGRVHPYFNRNDGLDDREVSIDLNRIVEIHEISLWKNGQEVFDTFTATVEMNLPSYIDRRTCSIYRVEKDGTYTKLDTRIEGDKIIFETNHFSEYILTGVVEDLQETTPCDVHVYDEVRVEPSCTEPGKIVYTCYCGDTYSETIKSNGHNLSDWYVVAHPKCETTGTEQRNCSSCDYSETQNIPATGHNYNNGVCTSCGDDLTANCYCNCHAGGIKGLIFKIILFFQKLFRKNQICEGCGVYHY